MAVSYEGLQRRSGVANGIDEEILLRFQPWRLARNDLLSKDNHSLPNAPASDSRPNFIKHNRPECNRSSKPEPKSLRHRRANSTSSATVFPSRAAPPNVIPNFWSFPVSI